MGWERFVASVAEAEGLAMPAHFDYLDFLEAGHARVRRYAPRLLEAFDFRAAPSAEPLIETVGVLREVNTSGKRKVPDDVPTSFVKPRWRDHVVGSEGEMFGFPRRRAFVAKHAEERALEDFLLEELYCFVGEDWEQEDDITLLTLHRSVTRS